MAPHQHSDPTAAPSAIPSSVCVVCATPTPLDHSFCSRRCASQAQREVDRNVARLYRLRRSGATSMEDRLRELIERNGALSQALMRWRAPLTE